MHSGIYLSNTDGGRETTFKDTHSSVSPKVHTLQAGSVKEQGLTVAAERWPPFQAITEEHTAMFMYIYACVSVSHVLRHGPWKPEMGIRPP